MTPPTSIIPPGLCQCGCGKITAIAKYTCRSKGIFKGNPLRYCLGHQRRIRPAIEDAVPFKIEGEYCRFIHLPDGYIAIVSLEDYPLLASYSWHLKRDKSGRVYVVRKGLIEDGSRFSQIAMHRQVLRLGIGDRREGDHANGNTLENRRGNLRPASDLQNARNARTRKDNTSGFKGVSRHGNGWRYRIWTDQGRKTVGGFITPEEAFAARCARVADEHREFARVS